MADLELVGGAHAAVQLHRRAPDGQRGRINGWTQVNAAVSYGPPQGNWEVFLSARNLFDRLYIVDRARGVLPGQPFMIQAGFTVRM